MRKTVIIGSGIGGIAAAIRSRSQGHDVTVFEATSNPGGKLNQLEKAGYRFDAGPSLFTMPDQVDELFELSGENPRAFFNYKRKRTLCHYFWEDQTRFQASASFETFEKDALVAFDTTKSELRRYLHGVKAKYDATANLFLKNSLHRTSTYLSRKTIKAILSIPKLSLTQTLDNLNSRSFGDPKLVQLFNRYATYNGSSPYKTPGIMSMIPHLEMYFGTYIPENGMYDITKQLYELAVRKGVKFYFDHKVEAIKLSGTSVCGVKHVGGVEKCDTVISNADIHEVYTHLLTQIKPPKATINLERSSSALIFYWGIGTKFKELDLHNIFFSDNYKEEFRHIFDLGGVFEDPTVYVNITAKDIENDAPAGKENWFVMINVPSNKGQDWDALIHKARKYIVNKLNRILSTDIEALIEVEEHLDPRKIEQKTGSYQGSLYGTSSNNRFSAFLRHPNFSRSVKGLYFTGGSVHPGGGIPLALNSAKIVSNLMTG